jgi:hypothetical protein
MRGSPRGGTEKAAKLRYTSDYTELQAQLAPHFTNLREFLLRPVFVKGSAEFATGKLQGFL